MDDDGLALQDDFSLLTFWKNRNDGLERFGERVDPAVHPSIHLSMTHKRKRIRNSGFLRPGCPAPYYSYIVPHWKASTNSRDCFVTKRDTTPSSPIWLLSHMAGTHSERMLFDRSKREID